MAVELGVQILILRLGILESIFAKPKCKKSFANRHQEPPGHLLAHFSHCGRRVLQIQFNDDCRKLKIEALFFMNKANGIFCTLEAWKSDRWIMPNRNPRFWSATRSCDCGHLDAWAQRPLPAEFGVNFSFYDSGSFGILWQSRLGLELGVRISESH